MPTFKPQREHIPAVAGFIGAIVFAIALQKGMLDWIPNGVVIAGFLIFYILWGFWIWTHEALSPNYKGLIFVLGVNMCVVLLGHYVSKQAPQEIAHADAPRWSVEGNELILKNEASKQARWVRLTLNMGKFMPFSQEFNLMLIARVKDDSIEALTDTGIAESALFTITDEVRAIQIDLSKNFIKHSDAVSHRHNEMSLQIYFALIPKHIRAEQVLTIGDITSLGGRQLQSNPSAEIKSPTPFK